MSNRWFRMYHEFATDPVIQCLAFEDQRHYVVILCMKCDGLLDRKVLPSMRDRLIYRALGLDPNSAEEAKRRLSEVGLIDKNWQPKGWDKRQFQSDSSTERSRKYRKNKESCNVAETSQQRHRDAPDTDTDTDKDNPPIVPPKKYESKKVSFDQWLDSLPEESDSDTTPTKSEPVPKKAAVRRYAKAVGLPPRFLELAMHAFEQRYTEELPHKRYADWAPVFRRCVKENWLKLWFLDGHEYRLTTRGQQLEREINVPIC